MPRPPTASSSTSNTPGRHVELRPGLTEPVILKDDYVRFVRKLYRVMIDSGTFDDIEATTYARQDWERDSKNEGYVTRERFGDAMLHAGSRLQPTGLGRRGADCSARLTRAGPVAAQRARRRVGGQRRAGGLRRVPEPLLWPRGGGRAE